MGCGAPSTPRPCSGGPSALSELYQGVLSDCLTEALGWGWEPRERAHSPVPRWEVAGVPQALMDEFSQRSSVIEQAKDAMVAEFVAAHGRQPTAREVIRMRQQATLETRPEKDIRPLAELVAGWRARADRFVGDQSRPSGWPGWPTATTGAAAAGRRVWPTRC